MKIERTPFVWYPPSPDDKKTAANYPSTIFKVYDI